MNILKEVEKEQIAKLSEGKSLPTFKPGDTLKVHTKVKEGDRERIQVYEGVCIARKNDGLNSSFTVRKISFGEGVERVFPLYSPNIANRPCPPRQTVFPARFARSFRPYCRRPACRSEGQGSCRSGRKIIFGVCRTDIKPSSSEGGFCVVCFAFSSGIVR